MQKQHFGRITKENLSKKLSNYSKQFLQRSKRSWGWRQIDTYWCTHAHIFLVMLAGSCSIKLIRQDSLQKRKCKLSVNKNWRVSRTRWKKKLNENENNEQGKIIEWTTSLEPSERTELRNDINRNKVLLFRLKCRGNTMKLRSSPSYELLTSKKRIWQKLQNL